MCLSVLWKWVLGYQQLTFKKSYMEKVEAWILVSEDTVEYVKSHIMRQKY